MSAVMDNKVQAVIDEYEERYQREVARMARSTGQQIRDALDDLLIPVGAEVGRFMNRLIKASGAKTIIELGMSYGYSSIYLGEAARATGGRLITTEIHPAKIEYATKMHQKAGLADVIEIRAGDVRKTLADAKERFDFVLVDLWNDLYVEVIELFYPKLAPGAYIVGDNMIYPPETRAGGLEYRTKIKSKPHIDSVLLPLGSGIELSRYAAGLDQWEIAAKKPG